MVLICIAVIRTCTQLTAEYISVENDLASARSNLNSFFEADYSQLELRIAADYSGDPTMIRIYNTGGDIHTETAKTMTGGREPTKEERSKAKAAGQEEAQRAAYRLLRGLLR